MKSLLIGTSSFRKIRSMDSLDEERQKDEDAFIAWLANMKAGELKPPFEGIGEGSGPRYSTQSNVIVAHLRPSPFLSFLLRPPINFSPINSPINFSFLQKTDSETRSWRRASSNFTTA